MKRTRNELKTDQIGPREKSTWPGPKLTRSCLIKSPSMALPRFTRACAMAGPSKASQSLYKHPRGQLERGVRQKPKGAKARPRSEAEKVHLPIIVVRVSLQKVSVQELKDQIGQLTKLVSERRPESLPTEKEQVKGITLRSGKELVETKKKIPHETDKAKDEKVENVTPVREECKPPIPYPKKLMKDRLDAQYRSFRREEVRAAEVALWAFVFASRRGGVLDGIGTLKR
ncbi:F-box/LRR-repeat protein 13-like [Gossypium australe]|uniref:F-box/LRR-repeat protein 13-like n=1 Tax=Gossypium australe TaxID=47621 RepID=A0A5B6V969_9ROSI|nr:F-box/LRR-repeat protein 13-like [Gossypium australe]